MANTENAKRQAEIDARVAAVTEWESNPHDPSDTTIYNEDGPVSAAYTEEDMQFIIHARDDLEWQGSYIEELKAEIADDYDLLNKASDVLTRQRARINDLEAERDELKAEINGLAGAEQARIENWNRFVEESKCVGKARKWARRWKKLAKAKIDKLCEMELVRFLTGFAGNLRLERRVAALENAARCCATCLYHVSDLEPVPEYCNEHCRKPDIRHAGWVFDEKRFARKGMGTDDNHRH